MANYTLKVRRYQPESGEGALLGGVRRRPRPLALGPRRPAAGQRPRRRLALGALFLPGGDLRLLRDEGQRPVRPRLQDPSRRGPGGCRKEGQRQPRRQRRDTSDCGRADGEHARDQGPDHRHGVDPLDQDPPCHPLASAPRRAARARVRGRARVDDRHHPVDGLHPVRRLRLLLPLDGSRPRLHRPRRPGQGLPLRRRPARRRDQGAPPRPRPRPARDLRLHPLLQLHRRLPQGRGADGPDHAPAPQSGRGGDRGPQQRPPPRARLRQHHREEGDARRGGRCRKSPSPSASKAS